MTVGLRSTTGRRRSIAAWAVALGAFVAVIALSLTPTPDPDLPDSFEGLPHALAYALLTTALLVASQRRLPARHQIRWPLAVAVPIGVIVLGAALEWAQGFVGRDVETADIVANAVGVSVAFALWLAIRLAVAVVSFLRARR